jgi:hypothetical protein
MDAPQLGRTIHDAATTVTSTNPMKDFIAGTISGVCGVIAGHPFDTIKVVMQTHPDKHSVMHHLKNLTRSEGVRGLFKGLVSPMLGVGVINSILYVIFSSPLAHMIKIWYIWELFTLVKRHEQIFILFECLCCWLYCWFS